MDKYKLIRVIAYQNFELSDKTITLPNKIYSECIDNAEKVLIAKYPIQSHGNILKLSDLKVVLSPNDYCELSLDLCRILQPDFNGALISIIKQK